MENLNSVKKLLLFLEDHGPGQWVIITNELGRIIPVPEFRFKYAEYAEQIKSFLTGIESEGLVQIKIGNQDLYNLAFGDLNNVFCDLEKHDVRAKITKEGLEYIGIIGVPLRPTIYFGQYGQINYHSPGAVATISGQGLPHRKESPAERLKKIAKTIIGAKAVFIALFSFLTSLGIAFSIFLHKTVDSSQRSKSDSLVPPVWPSNLRYINLDTVTKISSSDLIFIAWVKGHQEDSIIAHKLYFDMKAAGCEPQQIQELIFIDKANFKSRQFKLESHRLYGNTRGLLVTINPEFNFLKQ